MHFVALGAFSIDYVFCYRFEMPVTWDDPETVIVPIYMREKR